MTTDPIGDLLTRMRNAISRKHDTVDIPHSKLKAGVLDVLKYKHLIEGYTEFEEGTRKYLKVSLKYVNNKSVITELTRISKPGRRVYADYKTIPVVRNNYGFMILSTSKGVMDTFRAKKEHLGGEIMCEVF